MPMSFLCSLRGVGPMGRRPGLTGRAVFNENYIAKLPLCVKERGNLRCRCPARDGWQAIYDIVAEM